MSANVPHEIRQGDTSKPLYAELQYKNASGTLVARDVTGLTVTFQMVNAADGTVKVSGGTVTAVTAASGIVSYSFSTSDVDTPGIFWGSFTVTDSGKTDTYPVSPKQAVIWVHGDTQTAKEAYEEAL